MATKSAYYFSHDFNARNDEKIVAIRMKYGMEGYGIYFAILERMGESSEYIHVKDYNVIAFDLRVNNSLIRSIIEDFGLFEFTEDGKHFYSVSFSNRMRPLYNMREQRRIAGIKSAEKRKSSSLDSETNFEGCAKSSSLDSETNLEGCAKNTDLKQNFNDRSTTVEENCNDRCQKNQQRRGKEIKGKERKESDSLAREVSSDSEIFSISQLKELSGTSWLEDVGMKLHVTPDKLNSLYNEFCDTRELSDYSNTINDFRRHFINWLNIKKEKEKEKSSAKKEKISKFDYNANMLNEILTDLKNGK